MKWIKDEEFIRGNIPMTKFDIRALTIVLLSIEEGDILLDIGAGTGSVSIEGAFQGAEVWAVEKEEEGIELIKKNSEKFKVDIKIIEGQAPESIPQMEYNKCFIGGSGGRLEDIFDFLEKSLEKDGIVCANFVTLKNLNQFIELLEKYNYKDIETRLIQTAKISSVGLMKGNNPIFLVKGVKR